MKMNKFYLIAFFILSITACSTFNKNPDIFFDRESRKVYVVKDDKTVFETKTSYWDIKGNYIAELYASGNDITIYLYDYTKDELTEYPFNFEFDSIISGLDRRYFFNHYISLLPSGKTLFYNFDYKLSPGIYSMDLRKEGSSVKLIYPTHQPMSWIEVSKEYLCFKGFFDSLWVKSLKNDSLYGMCLSNSCLDPTSSGEYPISHLLIESNKLLIMMSDGSLYVLNLDNLTRNNLDNLTKSNFNNSMHLGTYKGNSFLDRKFYYYMWEIGAEVDIVDKVLFSSFDLDSYEIDSNIFEISKPEEYYTMFVDSYSIDKDDKLHIYIEKLNPSPTEKGEYDEWYDYIVFDLKTRKIISKEENLEKIERYLIR